MTTPAPGNKPATPPRTVPGATYAKAPPVNTPSILVMGPSGTGKTDSLITLLEAGLKVFVIVTEGGGIEILLDSVRRRLKGKEHLFQNLHWAQIMPSSLNTKALLAKARLSNTMGVADMQKTEQGLERNKYPQYMNLIRLLDNLVCQRTGEVIGNVATLDDSWALVVDSMTGLNQMIAQHVKGHRPTMTRPEYGVCQEHIRDMLALWTSLRCFFVLVAHVSRETNDVTGQERVTASTIGQALTSEIPAFFSEIVKTGVVGDQYIWSTLDQSTDVKHRALPRDAKIKPTFVPIVEAYRRRKAEAEAKGELPDDTQQSLVTVDDTLEGVLEAVSS